MSLQGRFFTLVAGSTDVHGGFVAGDTQRWLGVQGSFVEAGLHFLAGLQDGSLDAIRSGTEWFLGRLGGV